MRLVLLVVLGATATIGFAMRPALAGTVTMYALIAAGYLLLAALAAYRMWDDGTLIDRLMPRWGDLSIGAAVTAILLLGTWAGRSVLAPPMSPRHAWLFHLYYQLGAAERIQMSVAITALLVVIPVLEEITWRGMVLDLLSETVGSRRAPPLDALLYAVSVTPTMFTLADPVAGPNPLLFFAALGCGIFFSYLASITRRLPPVIIAHIAFTYFSATQFRAPGL